MKEKVNPGVVNVTNDRMLNVTGTEGGVSHNSARMCHNSVLFHLPHSAVVVPCSSVSSVPNEQKRRGRERPPRKAGDHVALIAALCHMPLSGPVGVAPVLIDPCGKADNQATESEDEAPESIVLSQRAEPSSPVGLERTEMACKGGLGV